jgi:phosphoglycolate phosphatase-like HAD superfamily hydrolase
MDIGLDFDGTLVTCRDRHVALMRASARRLGVPLDVEAYWQAKREGHANPAALAAAGVDRDAADALCALWSRDIERPPWLWFDQPIRGIEQALSTLVAGGQRLHLLTARRSARHLWLQLERSRLSRFMTSVTVIEQSNVAEQKAAELAARRCSFYVGDTESDHEAADRAGVRFGAVACGMRSEAFLRARGVTAVQPTLVEHIHDLLHA